MTRRWPFDQAPNTAVIATAAVVEGSRPIICVTRDLDDGGWQFLDGSRLVVEEARVIALSEVLELDNSIRQIADLPLGASATRRNLADGWSIDFVM
jgi:hypothetical protein